MIKIINVIGYSNSGKTYFIETATKLLRKNLDINIAVIKNIHEHMIDEEGKDTYKFINAGANYAITKNKFNETTIFIKKELSINDLIHWLDIGPFSLDVVFTEGFRNIKQPTILCIKGINDLEEQINKNIEIISGRICSQPKIKNEYFNIPLIDIKKHFNKFLQIFNITSF